MWGLFELLKFSLSSIVWGILITLICLVLFFISIRGWYKNAIFTPGSYIVGVMLFFLLAFQSTMIVGAIKIIHISDYYEKQISQLINKNFPPNQEISKQQSEQLTQWLINEYPILQHYISNGEFTGYTAQELPEAIVKELRSFLRRYILHRLFWCLGFVIVSTILIITSLNKRKKVYSRSQRGVSYTFTPTDENF